MPPVQYPRIRVAIDRGGTFTDIYAEIEHLSPDTSTTSIDYHVLKLLSVDPDNYSDAPREGIRRIIQIATGEQIPNHAPLNTSHIEWIRMGTTVGTNALLERDGEPCALVTTAGLKDMLAIGNQTRPNIFDLRVAKMGVLYTTVVEADERVRFVKNSSDASPNQERKEMRASTVKPSRLVESSLQVHKQLDVDKLKDQLEKVHASGITSLAVALMHSYGFKHHEHTVRQIAQHIGFKHISLSCELTPMVKIVPRGFTATVDAYLTPKIRQYLTSFRAGFEDNLQGVDVQFMQSDGGLCDIDNFCGYVAILSGPAGGVVGYGRSSYGYEVHCPETPLSAKPTPVIGFDMGGTSTDVSRYAGRLEHVFETETAGVTIQAPQLDINTVAAGGGSRLFFRSGMFYVGPESAGAHPGPVCYRKGGHLTVTDANLMLGRIVPELFPHIFGPNADEPLDVNATRVAFAALTNSINEHLRSLDEPQMSAEDVAEGFIKVANETMCRPIRQLTEAKGYDVRDHNLACFGGAGGQHACAIARSLGIKTVFVHKYSGILSAYGIALADSVVEKQEPVEVSYYDTAAKVDAFTLMRSLRKSAYDDLVGRGFKPESIKIDEYLNMRYEGTDFGIMVQCPSALEELSPPELGQFSFDKIFTDEYTREHGFSIPRRNILIDDVRVRARSSHLTTTDETSRPRGEVIVPKLEVDTSGNIEERVEDSQPALISRCYYSEENGWLATPVWRTKDLVKGRTVLPGPCLIVDTDAGITIVVDPGCTARIASDGNVVIKVDQNSTSKDSASVGQAKTSTTRVDHVKLSIYAHRFMGIAEQMGRTLQRTAISTNIKERLDFSCALFDETGGLVANAPHVPVHLGAMQDAVRYQIRTLGDDWAEGEVLLSNHPSAGGTHLPDVTIITPVYYEGAIVFYVASRGHQADIGGTTPGSMPPFSKSLSDEGFAVESLKLVKDGRFQEEELRSRLKESGCRCIPDVISDIRAQVAANKKGITLVTELIDNQGLTTVLSYMHHIQEAAAHAVREMLQNIAQMHNLRDGEVLSFSDFMDDGTEIKLGLSIDSVQGSAMFDFSESGPEVTGNTNAPEAVTSSAIIYALRCLVDQDIPLNQGCMDPISIKLSKNSILSPSSNAAVVGGNVLTSQRVTDVILGAFGACAASQGCMNNFTFGDNTMGYYETVAGGCGAGPGWDGTSGVQVHMTNTRMTDPEILERRYPAVVRNFSYREGSGGSGEWSGGNGLVRTIEFTRPLTVAILSERRQYAPWGLNGGNNGEKGKNELIHADGSCEMLGGKSTVSVQSGDMIRISTPGGGGYGQQKFGD